MNVFRLAADAFATLRLPRGGAAAGQEPRPSAARVVVNGGRSKIARVALLLAAIGPAAPANAQATHVSDEDIIDAYHYMLGRWLVLRQENLDLKEGFKWNEVIHRDVGGVAWANPNLDVVYSEAWIAVDDSSCTIVELPAITGRYYTVQVLNGWGETTANINDRNNRQHPFGKFALCLKATTVFLPVGAQRIELPGKQARILMRIELGADPAAAVRLQKQIKLYPTGSPKIDPLPATLEFANDRLPGVEGFDRTEDILASEPDINPGMAALQVKARAVARAATDPQDRGRIDGVIRQQAILQFFAALQRIGSQRNGWQRPSTIGNYGSDYLGRSLVNLAGIWANNNDEAVYFKSNTDGEGQPLNGSTVYTMTFPGDELPQHLVRYFWSVIAVDSANYRVIPNPLDRYLLNKQSGVQPNADGSLTLVLANQPPSGVVQQNWLPTPAGQNYHLTFRFYGPAEDVKDGAYFPPPLVKAAATVGTGAR
jgi:hypothetical protein